MNKKYTRKTKAQIEEIIQKLIETYGEVPCGLNFTTPFSLVVGLILAAQCTDIRVNQTTPIFFSKYKTIEDVKDADINDIIQIIKPCGFSKNKSRSIKESARIICEEFNGNVPCTMEELTKLCGIGRKSANIILQECFGKIEGIAVDTHVTRLTRKMGFSNGKNPVEIEKDLLKKIDKKYWKDINMVLVTHGRNICIANRPKCDICPINDLCSKND